MSNRTSEERDLQHTGYPDICDKLTATAEVSRIFLPKNAGTDALTTFGFDHQDPSPVAARIA
jgi:hypothetical protein